MSIYTVVWRKCIVWFVGAMCTPWVLHAESLDEQRVVYSSSISNTDYRFALGSIKKVNAVSEIERELQLRGKLERKTYEFNRQVSTNDAWDMLMAQFSGASVKELFACDGLDCGSSNAWANKVFEIKQLYGLDQSQRYRALGFDDVPGKFLALYFVQRGNRRVYAQVDIITTDATLTVSPSGSTIATVIQQQGYYVVQTDVSAQSVTFRQEELDALVQALRKKPFIQYYLVGHAYSESAVESNTERGRSYAKKLADELIGRGVKPRRLQVTSVGNLAPRARLAKARVELVVKR